MALFEDFCDKSNSTKINIVEYEEDRYYLLPDHLEWYYQKKELPISKFIIPKKNKKLNYDFGKTEFDQLLVVVTNKCNIVCDYCFRGYNFKKKDEINFEDFKKIANHFYNNAQVNPTIQFTGGEVFVKKNIEHWFKYINDKGFRIWMTTNGVSAKISNNEIIKNIFSNNHKHHIRISLDGHKAEIHEAYRQKGTFNKIIKNIKFLKSINASISVKSVITKDNVQYLEEMLDMCYDLKLEGWNYNVIRYTGALAKNPPLDSTAKIDKKIEYFGYYELGVRLIEILFRKPHLSKLLAISRFGKILNTLYLTNPKAVPMSYYVLKFDGNVYYNDNLQFKKYSPGNIDEIGLDAFNGLKSFRNNYDYDLPACKKCPIHRFCFQKGDYGELYENDVTLNSEFPNCDDIRKHYFHLMSLKEKGKILTLKMFNKQENNTVANV
ncbi:radical SAM protein [Olleya sp. R77988]|uniref:radical SAM protein n=1 Tax=Olleya sp. R77988 TaxID=3093875 RepID=UPI0037C9922B